MRPRWQSRREPVSHADDWLMTYADMITLLLCFFAIFLFISIPRKDLPQKAEIALPMPLTVQPTGLAGNPAFRSLIVAGQPTEDLVAETLEEVEAPPARMQPPRVRNAAFPVEAREVLLSRAVNDTRPSALPEIVDTPQSPTAAEAEPRGDRITTFEISSAAFFDSGSATLSTPGESILRGLAADLKSDRFKDYQITVEGHTDDAPISTARFPSNWELSTARASAVVHFFLDQGIPAMKLRAAGYADTFPKAPNRDANGTAIPQNQSQNRRVVIKLERIEKTASRK
jgi:flagellar motor protein MotB